MKKQTSLCLQPALAGRWQRLCTVLVLLLVTACDSPEPSIEEQGVLRVVTRNGPTTFYEDRNGFTGFEYELVKLFARHLDVKLEISSRHSLPDIFNMLSSRQAHLAAAGLTITPERQQRFEFSPPYMTVEQYLIYRQGSFRPRTITDLVDKRITVLAGSTHEAFLKQQQQLHPALQWHAATDLETVDLLEMLNDGEIDATLIDSNEYTANKGFYPGLKIGFSVGEPGQLGWVIAPGAMSEKLRSELARFFDQIIADGTLKQLEERFYSHSQQLTQIGSRTFTRAVETKLPDYEDLIKKVAAETSLDWRLLAAISYQESHWNPKARSPTGVRGMMMLTLPTAREMQVKNRLDAEQSLRGGARYFIKIRARIAPDIPEPDRTWLALAAYNVGLGHVEDAMEITRRQGGNPDKWIDVKDHLPLLRKRKWYQNTRHGYARGDEPVNYVQNIRHFHDILAWADLNRDRSRPPQNMDQYLPSALQQELGGI